VTRDIIGIRIIKTERGKSLSMTSNPLPSALLMILAKVILKTDPDPFMKFMILPLKNNEESTVIRKRYTD
jgi:hypothetical protein